ncbi:MAG: fatty acid desaturase [Pseudomonadota bacterium]
MRRRYDTCDPALETAMTGAALAKRPRPTVAPKPIGEPARRFDIAEEEIVRRLAPFHREDEARSTRAFVELWAVMGGAIALGLAVDNLFVRLAVCVFLSGLFARAFAIYHDTEHGAIFRKSPIKKRMMQLYGALVLSPPSSWSPGHRLHHQDTGACDTLIEGEFPVWSVERWRSASRFERFVYRASRHPITISLGYFSAFLYSSVLRPFLADPLENWKAGASIAAHYAMLAGAVWACGWQAMLLVLFVPMIAAGAIGIYLIYVQHNAPTVTYSPSGVRDVRRSAIEGTTYFRMSRFMHWLTGNIGYHNIHHLAPRIPFYRLPEAMAAIPELVKRFPTTSWSLTDIRAALSANLWDPACRRMVSFSAA